MKVCRVLVISSLFLGAVVHFSFSLPGWADSFGTETPYSRELYITGFGVCDVEIEDTDALAAAKHNALEDLIRKIKVQVTSSIVSKTIESDTRSSTSVSMVNQSISNMRLTGVHYEIARDTHNTFALAYVSKNKLSNFYIDKGRTLIGKIEYGLEEAEKQEQKGETAQALESYITILPLFPELIEYYSIYQVIKEKDSPDYFDSLGSDVSLSSIIALEVKTKSKLKELETRKTSNFTNALDTIAFILKQQGIKSGNLIIPPLLYRDTDFSSVFGSYASQHLDAVLHAALPKGGEKTVVRGTYWERDTVIEIYLVAQSAATGEKTGAAVATFPHSSIAEAYSLKPENFEEAMKTRKELSEGAITDGGINIEIWTNKGNSNESLVFTEGEDLQLYFRVNQPAFLQLTYDLATGEKVLLEKSFYIGVDKVNRVVKLPYAFEVVPPLGVEHLIVTAFSNQPPEPNTNITTIDGERYEVFASAKEAVAQARGLKKIQEETNSEMTKVGEAFVTITTIPGKDLKEEED